MFVNKKKNATEKQLKAVYKYEVLSTNVRNLTFINISK